MDKRNNSGHCNSGDYNSGHYNSGYYNSGHCNSGYYNSGHCNSGNHNSGDYNSGDYNSGHYNSGHYNSGDRNSGFFCTETSKPTFFDQPVDMTWDEARALIPWIDLPVGCEWVVESEMTDEEKQANRNHKTLGGYLKVREKDFRVAFSQVWPTLPEETKQKFLSLPNFDAQKFLTITGVDVRKADEPAVVVPQEVVVDGRRYVLAQ